MFINSPCLTDKKELVIPGQTAIVNSVKKIHAIVDGKAVVISESSVRNELLFDDEDDITCLTNDDIFENLALMGYEQLSTKLTFQKGNVAVPGAKKPWGDALAPTRSERMLEKPNEPPLLKGHTSRSGEGSMGHTFKLMDIVPPIPHDLPLTGGYIPGSDEEKENDAQDVEILILKQKVKKLKRKRKSSISHLRRGIYRQAESSDDDVDEVESIKTGEGQVTKNQGVSTTAPRTPPTTTIVFDDEDVTMSMAQTLIKMDGRESKGERDCC
ncbi:hypothetical protein Tco_1265681 [Tanacetum coccineum]